MATKRVRNNGLHIPVELVEKILLNLPVKSLLCFSAVSKSWNRMIKSPEFRKRYRGREMIVLRVTGDEKAVVCPISLSSASIETATPFVVPFTAAIDYYSDVSCGELRCVEFENSLCLYNPSTRAYRKLPAPSCGPPIGSYMAGFGISVYVYGLGYDAAADDYKVVKFLRDLSGNSEVYSLKSDCWREREPCMPGNSIVLTARGAFVDGSLHWLAYNRRINIFETEIAIICFDVSTEKFREVATPESIRRSNHRSDVCVLRGRLCVCVNRQRRFVVWVYDNNNGWSKDLEIDYSNMYPLCYAHRLQPLYFYGHDGNLVRAVTCCTDVGKIFIYKLDEDGHSRLVESKFGGGYGILDSFTYVESLVSPFPLFPSKEERESGGIVEVEMEGSFITDSWAPWRGKYPEPTSREVDLIWPFVNKAKFQVEKETKNGLRSQIIKFGGQVRESKGYDVDEEDIDELVPSSLKKYGMFIPRNLNDEKNYSEAMAAAKFTVGEINDHMALMKNDKRYELVSTEKMVSTCTNKLLVTFSAKEVATQDLKTFQAMLRCAKTPPSTFKLREWKFKPLPIIKLLISSKL